MSYLASLGTVLALAAPPTPQHVLTVQHSAGPATVEYRGDPSIRYRQTGAVAPAGAPSTLRCAWTVDLTVDRVATFGKGMMLSRSFVRSGVAEGSRPGWCDSSRSAIQAEVRERVGSADRHVAAAAFADRPVLLAELDRAGPQASAR